MNPSSSNLFNINETFASTLGAIILIFFIVAVLIFISASQVNVKYIRQTLNPFSDTEKLIKIIHSQEEVVERWHILDINTGIGKLKWLPVGLGFKLYILFPAKFIETKTAYYIDRRIQKLASGFYWGFFIFLFLIYVGNGQDIFLIFGVMVFISSIIFSFLSATITGMNNVEILKKEWITNKSKGLLLHLSGSIPENSSFSLNPDAFLKTGRISLSFKQIIFPIFKS